MISAWNLLWIVPVSVWFGAFAMALFAGGDDKREDNCYCCPFPCERSK